MCGIAGIYRYKTGREVQQHEIESMCSVMSYRGPDGRGEYLDGELGLGHRRLTIIDTSERSNQPMLSQDDNVTICFNGELYNYLELKQELQEEGVKFATTSDTEVLMEMYRNRGLDSLQRLNGMYAYAIWDRVEDELLLVRDRVGIKPLYYAITDDGIVFGSELKSLLAVSGVQVEVNRKIIDSYMSVGYCPTNETLFENIFKLPPAHFLSVKNGEIRVEQYWEMEFEKEKDRGQDYYTEKTRELLKDAVRLQLRSDVPLGVFLSGGIDSSAVVAMMDELGVEDIKTFSVAWDYGKAFNETQYARQISKQFNTEHHEYFMSAEDFMVFLPDYIRHMDEPVTEAAAISLYYIAKKAKEHVTVVLSGEGADEVFGGYPIYKYMKMVHIYKKIPLLLRSVVLNPLLRMLGNKWAKYADLSEVELDQSYAGVSFYDKKQKEKLYTDEFKSECKKFSIYDALAPLYKYVMNEDLQRKMQFVDIKSWLVDDLLIKADRMSMAASLELRVPFLDHRFLEFAAKMPSKYRIKGYENKYVLKKALERLLPSEILYRKKLGFPTPLAIMFQGELRNYVTDILDSNRFHDRCYFKPAEVRRLLSEHGSGGEDHHKVLWQLLVLELWHREFVDA
ncbi:MAG: asparagine synthase (glutamine-hydrolyzing) [Pseudomonadales bacterium]|nr:asparagine synthase (glutamine-hydrolyzing) [Pseudomonadales bacterium]